MVYGTERYGEPEIKARRVVHLWLKNDAKPILERDHTEETLKRSIWHITKGCWISHGWQRTTKRDKDDMPSRYYDLVADMVIREFPTLAPYVVRKRASHVVRFEDINKAWNGDERWKMLKHVQFIYERKRFKWAKWYEMRNGRKP